MNDQSMSSRETVDVPSPHKEIAYIAGASRAEDLIQALGQPAEVR